MTNPTGKDSDSEKSSVLNETYHEIEDTYIGIKENVTEKLSHYLLTYGAALAHHPTNKNKKEETVSIRKDKTITETIQEDIRENIEIEDEVTEPTGEIKKEKKKDKKEKKNKKKNKKKK